MGKCGFISYQNNDCQRGSSMVEFIVSLLVFVPLFIGIPLLGKYADIKHKTIEASRYVAWERTVYSEPGASTRSDSWVDSGGGLHEEATKPSGQILAEAEHRVLGHPLQGFHDPTIRENPMWVNRKGESLLALTVNQNNPYVRRFLTGTSTQSSVTEHIDGPGNLFAAGVHAIARSGSELSNLFDGAQGAGGAAQDAIDNMGGILDGGGFISQDGCGFPGVNINHGIGLGQDNYARVDVSTPVINFLAIRDTGENLNFNATAAILSNAWTVPSEAKFHERLDNVVPNQLLGCITLPAKYVFGLLSNPFSDDPGFLFGEGKLAYPVKVQEAPSTTLPIELQYYDDTR